jgi:hypothetical protein
MRRVVGRLTTSSDAVPSLQTWPLVGPSTFRSTPGGCACAKRKGKQRCESTAGTQLPRGSPKFRRLHCIAETFQNISHTHQNTSRTKRLKYIPTHTPKRTKCISNKQQNIPNRPQNIQMHTKHNSTHPKCIPNIAQTFPSTYQKDTQTSQTHPKTVHLHIKHTPTKSQIRSTHTKNIFTASQTHPKHISNSFLIQLTILSLRAYSFFQS